MAIVEDVATRVATLSGVPERTVAPARTPRTAWTMARIAVTDFRALAGAVAAMVPLLLRRRPVGREGDPASSERDAGTG